MSVQPDPLVLQAPLCGFRAFMARVRVGPSLRFRGDLTRLKAVSASGGPRERDPDQRFTLIRQC